MKTFDIAVYSRDLSSRFDLSNLGLRFTLIKASSNVDGGYKQATFKVTGPIDSLNNLYELLRGKVEVYGLGATVLWAGCIWSVVVYNDRVKYSWTLDEFANSVSIIYLLQTINQQFSGAGSKAETAFETDTESVSYYGTKEIKLRGSNGSLAAANARRSFELEARKFPQINIEKNDSSVSEPYAIVTAKGWWDTLAWRYYENEDGNSAGYEQNSTLTSEAAQSLGLGENYSSIQFYSTDDRIEANGADAGFLNLATGSYFFVQDTASNNKTWTVTSTPGGPGTDAVVTPANVTDEAAGTANIIYVGTKIWQTFTLETDDPFYAVAIDVRAQKNGATDNLIISLYSVSGGLPNVLLATGTVTNEEVPENALGWVTAVLSVQTNQIVFGTDYGILIERSSGIFTNGTSFNIGVDTSLSYSRGSLQLYTDATNGWKARPTDADLIFRVSGVRQTTDQITSIVDEVGEFITGVDILDPSGLNTLPYQDGSLTALQVIKNLMAFGSADGSPIHAYISSDRRLVIHKEEPAGSETDYLIDVDGLVRQRNEIEIPNELLPSGRWASIAPLELSPSRSSRVFLEEVEYNAEDDRLSFVKVRNLRRVLDITGFTQ